MSHCVLMRIAHNNNMQWTDEGFILSARKFSEYGAVITLFSRDHGLVSGMCKAALSSKQRGIYQPGNIVSARWNARLEEHLGTLSCELSTAITALLLNDRIALAALNSLCKLLPLAMHERDPHPALYEMAMDLLRQMAAAQPDWLANYVRFELLLLQEVGFGLDLTQCAATGQTESLTYVSPKSGRAVSAEAGAAYKERLLPLPAFLRQQPHQATTTELHDGLRLTGYFLHHWLLQPHNRALPDERQRLLTLIDTLEPTP